MDSFIKEVQRMNPPSPVALPRLVTSNLKLSNGDVLPKGTCIGISNAGVTSDPNIWDQPDEFDGFRFEKLRQKPGLQTSHQFVTTGKESLNFGMLFFCVMLPSGLSFKKATVC